MIKYCFTHWWHLICMTGCFSFLKSYISISLSEKFQRTYLHLQMYENFYRPWPVLFSAVTQPLRNADYNVGSAQ